MSAKVLGEPLVPISVFPRPRSVVEHDRPAMADEFHQLSVERSDCFPPYLGVPVLWIVDAVPPVALEDQLVDRKSDNAAGL